MDKESNPNVFEPMIESHSHDEIDIQIDEHSSLEHRYSNLPHDPQKPTQRGAIAFFAILLVAAFVAGAWTLDFWNETVGRDGLASSRLGQPTGERERASSDDYMYVSNPVDDLEELRARQAKIQETLAKVSNAVVSITDNVGSGSGVIVSEDGYVLTAGHVLLTQADVLSITMWDGTILEAEPLGRNLNIDAGMAKIIGEGPYPFVPIADTESVQLGDWCMALGHPGGYQLGRTPPLRIGRVIEVVDWMLVTDCTLVGGDSGGPLFDLDGNLIGIHSSIGQSVAENRHVRIDGFDEAWDRMASGEAWGRLGGVGPLDRDSAYLGITLDLNADEAVVLEVTNGSAADEAGIQAGDVVLELDGNRVSDSADLISQVAEKRAGHEFTVRIRREGRRIRLRGELGRAGDSNR